MNSEKVVKSLLSFFTMTETIQFQNLNKKMIRKPYDKLVKKHQRSLIINSGLTRVERIRLWYNKTQLLKAKKIQKGQLPHLYRRLAKKPSSFYNEILIDADRTFPHILLFNNKGKA